MNAFEAAILGVVQGLTEFLPISSSAHLIFAQYFLGMKDPLFLFDLALHAGTLLATILLFYKEIKKLLLSPRAIGLILCAGIPTGIIGLLLNDTIESLWTMKNACIELFITGTILWLTQFSPKKNDSEEILFSTINYPKAFLIGIAQGLAIFPGISRSGATIAAALFLHTGRRDAGNFSFLLSIPSIIGALGLKFLDISSQGFTDFSFMTIGFTSSLIIGFFSLLVLMKLIVKGKFYKFSYYCWVVSILGLVWLNLS